MNKYDFGYEIQPNTTNDWAFQKIKPNSRILEFGSSNGMLTKNLNQKKNCIIDIVEISEQSAKQAAQFATRVFMGEVQGNIENYIWYEELKDQKYDYIVFLDVLEHLHNPKEVLIKCKELLQDDGSILLSVPNIAHNSIIINLIENKFEYTDVGLLDNTHIHFFAYDTLCKMIHDSGFCATQESALQLPVGSNEIENSYKNIPKHMAQQLRLREFADVYQFIFELKKNQLYTQDKPLSTTNLDATLYPITVFIKEKEDNEFTQGKKMRYYANPNKVCMHIDLSGFSNVEKIRIDPLDSSCVLKNLQLYTKEFDKKQPIEISEHNGVIDANNHYIFGHNDPQLIINMQPHIQNILYFEYECSAFDDDAITFMQSLEKQNCNYKLQISEFTQSFENEKLILMEYQNSLQEQLEEKICDNTSLHQKLEENISKKEMLEKTLNDIYSSKGWKFIQFIRRIKQKIKEILGG